MKKGFLVLLLCLASQAFSFQNTHSTTSVFLDFLMWQTREVSDDNWAQIISPAAAHQQIQFLNVPFQFDPGVRVGIRYNHPENPWNTQFYYTGYKTTGRNHAQVNSEEIHSTFAGNFYANNLAGNGISGPYYHQAGIQWNIVLNALDLEIGRTSTINERLSLRPFTGLKAAMIHQKINTRWYSPYEPTTLLNPTPTPITTFSSAREDMTNDFNGIGPSAGLDSTWNLYKTNRNTVSLIGNFSGAFLWGHWRLGDQYRNNTPVSITVLNDSLSTAAPMTKAYLGLEWVNASAPGQFNVRLGYEGQFWFNQLRYYTFSIGKTNDALFMQGGILEFLFTFN